MTFVYLDNNKEKRLGMVYHAANILAARICMHFMSVTEYIRLVISLLTVDSQWPDGHLLTACSNIDAFM